MRTISSRSFVSGRRTRLRITPLRCLEHVLVQASRTEKRGVELLWVTGGAKGNLGKVRCADHEYEPALFVSIVRTDGVNLEKKLSQYLLRNGTRSLIAIAILEHTVDFVEEDDARTAAPSALEDLANPPLALSNLFADQLGDLGTHEVQVTQLRTRPQNSRLSGTRRTVQQDARGRRYTEMTVLLGITRSRQIHLGMQTGIDDVVVEALLQRRIPADGREVP